ncbi:hypothetical protein FACS1894132_10470 [Clostridia bacterium]|nr:hypothetical protein FACS1894132_10470 [Clostridia bacterium]
MQQEITVIDHKKLLETISFYKQKKARLIAITASSKENTELSYSFDANDTSNTVQKIVRINITNETIDSISEIYPYAFLYENEIKELFGVKIKNISLDFDGNLYKVSKKEAFNPNAKEETFKKTDKTVSQTDKSSKKTEQKDNKSSSEKPAKKGGQKK